MADDPDPGTPSELRADEGTRPIFAAAPETREVLSDLLALEEP